MGITLNKATKIINQYKGVYPQVFSFMENTQKKISEDKYSETMFGRRRHLENIVSYDKTVVQRALRQGFNFIVQSTASDILLSSLVGIGKRLEDEKLDAKIVATVHDSIEIVSSMIDMKEVCEIIYDEMVNYPYIKKIFGINLSVPLKIDMEVGTSFGDGKQVEFSNGKMTNEGKLLAEIITTQKNLSTR
jgi:DNA polymerase-1